MVASASKFIELSMVPDLAVEVAAQMNGAAKDARRLQELGMVGPLAERLVSMMNSGTYSATKLMELGMVGDLAAVVAASGGTPTFDLLDTTLGADPNNLSGWSLGGSVTITPAVAAPDGTLTASKVVPTVANSGHAATTSFSKAASRKYYRMATYAKPNTYNTSLTVGNGGDRASQAFDLATGALGAALAGTNALLRGSYISPSVNGYYRCIFDVALNASITTVEAAIRLTSGTSTTFAGNTSLDTTHWETQIDEQVLPSTAAPTATNVIVSTDMNSDIDDVVALSLLCNLHIAGECVIKAVLVDGSDVCAAPATKAMMVYSGLTAIPVGAYQGSEFVSISPFDTLVRDAFRPGGETRADYPTALSVARTALAACADGSVTLIAVGSLVNFRDLLLSPADGTSPLTGLQLATAKVARLVIMGGDTPNGAEHNFQILPSATKYVIENWPTEMVGIPFTGPDTIYTTIPIDANPATNPYKLAYNNPPSPVYYSARNGVISLAITLGGVGGTDGTYELTASGGTGSGFAGTATVSGGIITAVRVKSPGEYTVAPTIVTSAVPGLTGATITPTLGAWNGRASWDPMAVLLAIRGANPTNWYWWSHGTNVIEADGDNAITVSGTDNGNYTYARRFITGTAMASIINEIVGRTI